MKAIVLMLLFATPCFAQGHTFDIETLSHGALYFTTGSDLGTTWYGVLKDKRTEANPLLNTFKISDVRKRTFAQGGAVLGLTIAADFATHKMASAGHPKLAALCRFVIAGAHGYAVVQNLK